jgi:hypothetical protein
MAEFIGKNYKSLSTGIITLLGGGNLWFGARGKIPS